MSPESSTRDINQVRVLRYDVRKRVARSIRVEAPTEIDVFPYERANKLPGVVFRSRSRATNSPAGVDSDDVLDHHRLFGHRIGDEREHQLTLAGELAIDRGRRRTGADTAAKLPKLNRHQQLIARFHLTFEADIIDASKECKLVLVFLEHLQRDTTGLRHRFNDQHTGHNRVLREVALEERLVGGDVLDTDGFHTWFELDDAINQQERITVRKQLANGKAVHGERDFQDVDPFCGFECNTL